MECYCDIQLQNDDEYLLDDKNTQPLLQHFERNIEKNCSICKYRMRPETIHHNKPKDDTEIWPNGNGYSNNSEITTIIPTYVTSSHRPLSPNSSGDSADSSLLLNDINISSSEEYKEYHCHHIIEEQSQKWVSKRLMFTTILCFFVMFAELIGGYIAESLALMTDSAHMLIDVIGCVMALSAIFIGKKKSTKKYPFGYYRAEVIGALISVLFIWGLTGVFVYCAIDRLITSKYEIHSKMMLIVAVVGLITNIIQVMILHGMCSSITKDTSSVQSEHGHSHNINLRAAMLHVIGDLFQSIGVVFAAIIIIYYPHLQIVDPICTFIFSIIVLFTTRTVFKDSINALMEGFPLTLNYDQIFGSLLQIPDVKHIHNLQIWTLTMGNYNLAVHLAVDKCANKELILNTATVLLRTEYDIRHSTIQVETYNETIMLNCSNCQVPDG